MNKKPWVRLVIAISLDGRLAFPDGGKKHLGKEGDRRVLEQALTWCDATLMGSGTLRTNTNTCLIRNTKLIHRRIQDGRSSQPICLIVSTEGSFSRKLPFFEQPIERWLLCTKEETKKSLEEGFDHRLLMKNDWSATLSELQQKGLSKIVLLGGRKLISSLFLEDQVDELQLTLTPRIIGGQYTWTSISIDNLQLKLSKSNAWELIKIEDLNNSEILLKYYRKRS